MDNDKKSSKPGGINMDAELAEIARRLQPDMKRPKPNDEAIAAALQAVQRLASEVDAEDTAEDLSREENGAGASQVCRVCGHRNREGHKFCSMCGLPVASSGMQEMPRVPPLQMQEAHDGPESPALPIRGNVVAETHHYHHHYHHHYLPGGQEAVPSRPTGELGREADKMRASAALRGESMSRAEAAVRRVTQEWVLACNTKHLDDLLELYAADGLVLRSNCPQVRGAAAIREFFFGALGSGLGEVEVEPIRVEVVGDMAYEAGRCKALVPSSAGKRREERGKYVWVLGRQNNGEWKIAVDCWSSDLTLSGLESDITPAAKPTTSRKTP